MITDYALHAYAAWCTTDVQEKLRRTEALAAGAPELLPAGLVLPAGADKPLEAGRPARPLLVPPQSVAHRSPATREGRAALLHAVAHIEFNAINLALDVVWRWPEMPEDFTRDWLGVAGEEALHFRLLQEHLGTLQCAYGDFPAHDGLWDMARRTAHDLLHRLALVPRVLEARGLDASPGMRDRLANAGDARGAAILQRILDDEIGHVAKGSHWFRRLCAERSLDPDATFLALAAEYQAPRLASEPNLSARVQAGFTEREMQGLAEEARARNQTGTRAS